MRIYLALAMVLLLAAGCTANIRMTDVNLEAGHDMKVDASGATNATDTAQTADGDFSGLVEAVNSWIDKNLAGIVGKLKVSDLVKPASAVEEELAKPDALDDTTTPDIGAGAGPVTEVD